MPPVSALQLDSPIEDDAFISQTPSPRSPFPSEQDSLPSMPESPVSKDSALKKAKKHFKRRFMRKPSDPQAAEALGQEKPSKLVTLQPKVNSIKAERKFQEDPASAAAAAAAATAAAKKSRGGSSNMSIHGMSQWRYPPNKVVSGARELQQMDMFLYSKVSFESLNQLQSDIRHFSGSSPFAKSASFCRGSTPFPLPFSSRCFLSAFGMLPCTPTTTGTTFTFLLLLEIIFGRSVCCEISTFQTVYSQPSLKNALWLQPKLLDLLKMSFLV